MPDHQPSKIAARGSRARQRIIRRLANLDVDQLRHLPRQTVAVLAWGDIVDLIELRHRMRTPVKGSVAYYLAIYGVRIGRALDRALAKIKRMRTER